MSDISKTKHVGFRLDSMIIKLLEEWRRRNPGVSTSWMARQAVKEYISKKLNLSK